jgi:hypothetical protein
MGTRATRRAFAAGVAVLAVTLGSASLAMTVFRSANAAPNTSTIAGGSLVGVSVVRATTGGLATSETTYADLPGARATVIIPRGHRSLILSRFSASSDCNGKEVQLCDIQILIGSAIASPSSQGAFDSTALAQSAVSGASHSLDRSRGPLPAGTYVVKVPWRTTSSQVEFQLDDWSLTVEQVRVS